MSTLSTIQSTDLISNSRAVINNNFTTLNTDKMETSVLDTDTTLAANSDAKVATQKAVKAYVDAGGNVNASDTARGIVEEATQAETNAGTATGGTGARLFVNPSTLDAWAVDSNLLSKVATGATTYDLSTASGVQNIAHGLAVAPRMVILRGSYASGDTASSSSTTASTFTVYSNATQSSSYTMHKSSSGATSNESDSGSTFTIKTDKTPRTQTGVVTVDATNIIITWTKTSTPTGTAYLVWEAIA